MAVKAGQPVKGKMEELYKSVYGHPGQSFAIVQRITIMSLGFIVSTTDASVCNQHSQITYYLACFNCILEAGVLVATVLAIYGNVVQS